MSKKIMPVLITILVIAAILVYVLHQKYLVAATVNGRSISRLKIIDELEKQSGKKALDSVITQELILERAKKENISASQKDIDGELKKIQTTVAAQGTTIDEALSKQGLTKADLLKDIKLQILVRKLAKADDIKITDAEVEKYMTDNKEQFPKDATEKPDKNQIKEMLKQQKQQAQIQEFITGLRKDAKVTYFGSYK